MTNDDSLMTHFSEWANPGTESKQFCFLATDSFGLQTDRRCVDLVPTANPDNDETIKNIREMGDALLDGGKKGKNFEPDDVVDYGCAGRGTFDAFSKTLGKQVDQADSLFYIWKKCIQCASSAATSTHTSMDSIPEYDYKKDSDDCCKYTLVN